jgi:hypothetical protein
LLILVRTGSSMSAPLVHPGTGRCVRIEIRRLRVRLCVAGDLSPSDPARSMSSKIRTRLPPATAPRIAVTNATKPVVARNPSLAPTSAPSTAAASPRPFVWLAQVPVYPGQVDPQGRRAS